MEWLAKILDRQGIRATEEVFSEVRKTLPKHWVPKEEFNARIEEIRTLKEKLAEAEGVRDELRTQTEKSAELEAKIAALQEQHGQEATQLKEEMERAKLQATLELALIRSGARNVRAVEALLDTEKIRLEEGELIGLSEQLSEIRAENGFLFHDAPRATALGHGGAPAALSGVEAAFYARNPDLRP
jgi:DNA anti-recombination protein RmuC